MPYSAELAEQVAGLDKHISAEDRFFHLQQHLEGSFVFIHGQQAEGIYLPAFGDGLVLARTSEAGTELMKLRLQTKDTASFPQENKAAIDFLAELGFHPFKQAKRMRLGMPKNWLPQGIYNRIGGNLG